MAAFQEKRFRTRDGLSLYYRDYPNARSVKAPVLCLSGTTANSRVYEELAPHLQRERRVLCMDWRGHGQSDYDSNWRNYTFRTLRGDVLDLLAQEGIPQAVMIGSSVGGIVIISLAGDRPDVIAGAVINDAGPVMGEAGKKRVGSFMGAKMEFDSVEEASRSIRERDVPGVTLPVAQHVLRTRRTFKRRDDGKYVSDMDPNYGLGFKERQAESDLWPSWDAMRSIPTLTLRGAVSDLLDETVLGEMKRRHPAMETVAVPGRGHCPYLDEPEALTAIDRFLARLP